MSHKDAGRNGGPDFPCASLDEALRQLRRPPTPEAVRFKIQTVAGEVAQVAPYLDARLVFDRLDLVCWRSLGGRVRGTARARTVTWGRSAVPVNRSPCSPSRGAAPCDNQAMKEKETVKKPNDTTPAEPEQDGSAAPVTAEEDTDRRIDEIAERHRETLERLARD